MIIQYEIHDVEIPMYDFNDQSGEPAYYDTIWVVTPKGHPEIWVSGPHLTKEDAQDYADDWAVGTATQ